jgi:hypothetical protein
VDDEEHVHHYLRVETSVRVALFDEDGNIVHSDVIGGDNCWMRVVKNVPVTITSEQVKDRLTNITVGVITALELTLGKNGYLKMPDGLYEPVLLDGNEDNAKARVVNVQTEVHGDGFIKVSVVPDGPIH